MYDNQTIKLPIGWMFSVCRDVDALCEDTGFNPWCMNEGLAEKQDLHPITVGQAKKHGLLCDK